MTFPTRRTPDDPVPASPASEGGASDEQTAAAAGPPADLLPGPAARGRRPSPRPWETWEPGARVMVRTRLPEGASHLYTDVLGTITSRTAAALTIETRGGTVEVPLSSVATGKTVPPAPARRRPRDA